MTFEEWADANEIDHECHDYSIGLAQMAWIAATKAEREACAKVCEEQREKWLNGEAPNAGYTVSDFLTCAAAIRART